MNLMDIIGPVMVGPSSSHTAGAVKIGYVCNKLMGEPIARAFIGLHGSFACTGKGHGTDRALVAGLLGMSCDDMRIPKSFEIAKEQGLDYEIQTVDLGEAHPNSAQLKLTGASGRELEIIACSLGGGRIQICEIDGVKANVTGDYPTIIVHNVDQPGYVTEVSGVLGEKAVNIATMQLYRRSRGGEAVMVIECDEEVPEESIRALEQLDGIRQVTYLSVRE